MLKVFLRGRGVDSVIITASSKDNSIINSMLQECVEKKAEIVPSRCN